MQVVATPIGRFMYYPTRASTLNQLRKAGIISTKVESALAKKRPDGLIIVPNGPTKVAIEYKQPQELKSKAQISKAIAQELEVAKLLCKLLLVTDNSKTFWINTLTGNSVKDHNGKDISQVIDVQKLQNGTMTTEEIIDLEEMIDKVDASLTATCDQIVSPTLLDPSPLAKSLWQLIWINTGKEPEKCLYNVVELFVFKFLSDLGALKTHNNFDAVYALRQASSEDALTQYASNSRKAIRSLFPPGEDGTTIINGTIFVNEKGDPNLAQSSLFGDVLDLLEKFGKNSGSFRHIQRDFKTRLYEAFLRQSAGVKALGQYFTPRNVVRAMVQMSPASTLPKDARICDPFCGVGGFLLETIAEVESIYAQFEPRNGKISPTVSLIGFDKGSDEKDDERTIILAKANMMIYFSDLIAKHHSPSDLKQFSEKAFNKVFRLLRSNLGTFAITDQEPFDLILTNPPYVTSGVGSIRRAIDDEGLSPYYTCQGRGTEALSIEWIIKNLALKGHAIVVVPDGLLIQKPVLEYIARNCLIQGLISLPSRTFYSTAKKTYILSISKKASAKEHQTQPVFTYLVSEIGESRDSYRFPIKKNDLNEAKILYRQFISSPSEFETASARCKIIPFNDFETSTNWMIDRNWTSEEKQNLGISEAASEISEEDFISIVKNTKMLIDNFLEGN